MDVAISRQLRLPARFARRRVCGNRSLALDPPPGASPMGFQQTAAAQERQGQLPPDRPRPRAVRQRARGQVDQVHRRRRLRRLGRGVVGTRPAPVRHRRRRRRVRQGARRAWRSSTGSKSSPSRRTCRGRCSATSRRAKTLNFCSGKGEAKAAYKAWRQAGQQPAADRPVSSCPTNVGKLDPRRRRSRT